MQEKDNVLRILQETKDGLKQNDAIKLKVLSNQTIHTASITQDSDNVLVAVIVYSLSKMIERQEYQKFSGWEDFYKKIMSAIENTIIAIKKNDDAKIHENMSSIRDVINKVSGKLKSYIQDVFRKAEINKASKIYEHGISMEKTANLLGISIFELATYAGQKQDISNAPLGYTIEVKKRIKTMEDMFK